MMNEYLEVGPDYEDGCDHEGFVGGCKRLGHTPETCPYQDDQKIMPSIEGLLKDPAIIHHNMLIGKIAKISMRDCAHTHGSDMVERWWEFEEWERDQTSKNIPPPPAPEGLKPREYTDKFGSLVPAHEITFKEAWSVMELAGYQYGDDALENVKVGWDMAKGILK